MNDEFPRYREAYPELDVEFVGRGHEARSGTRRVFWSTEWGEIAGNGELTWGDTFDFVISYQIYSSGYIKQTQNNSKIRIGFLSRGLHNYRTSAYCPCCGTLVTKLYLRDDTWACSRCQGLRYRSTFLSPAQRWSEELSILNIEIKDGRPPGMRQATYQTKWARYTELRGKCPGDRRKPGPQFMHAIFATWDARKTVGRGATA